MASVQPLLEQALTDAVNALMDQCPDDPLGFIGAHLMGVKQKNVHDDLRPSQQNSVAREQFHRGVRAAVLKDRTDRTVSAALAAKRQPWSIVQWAQSLRLHESVASALVRPLIDLEDAGEEAELTYLKKLDRKSLERLLCGASPNMLTLELTERVWQGVELLREAYAVTTTELHAKYLQDGQYFTLSYGGLETFFGGLEALVGSPTPQLREAMNKEHTEALDSRVKFTTGNYHVKTTSEIEYWFVVAPQVGLQKLHLPKGRYPAEEEALLGVGAARQQLELDAFAADLAVVNAQLDSLHQPTMRREEVVGARLYTGPMFEKYNAVLRTGTGLESMQKKWDDLCMGNKYTTTLHVVNSAVVKLGKITVASTVWRGISGGVLPTAFWDPNEFGVRGGVEFGFTSTTRDQQVALQYARSQGSVGVVFEIMQGMVDRGADLKFLSQYPHEQEILFAPLTSLEVRDTRVEGTVLVVEVRLNVNLTALTIEQVMGKRAKLLNDMGRGMVLEVRELMPGKEGNDAASMMEQALSQPPFSQAEEWFNDDQNFAMSVKHALEVKRQVQEEVELRPWQIDPVSQQYINPHSLWQDLVPTAPGKLVPIRLLRGTWLIARAEALDCASSEEELRELRSLPRRQDLPEEAFIDVDELKMEARGNKLAGRPLKIVCVSYAWETPREPDPDGTTLRGLVATIKRERSEQVLRRNEPFPGGEFAVFWDWGCIHQGGSSRSELESEAFKIALKAMGRWYAHMLTTVLIMNLTGTGRGGRPFESRGWTGFETAVASLGKRSLPSSWAPIMFQNEAGMTRPPPRSPADFSQLLATKTFANGADAEAVRTFYETTASDLLGNLQQVLFENVGWKDEEAQCLAGALSLCWNAHTLGLASNSIGSVGVAAIADAFKQGAMCNLELFNMTGNQISDAGAMALAEAWACGCVAKLTRLYLAFNQITDTGIRAVAEAMACGALPALTHMDVSGNQITDTGIRAVAEAMASGALPALTHMDVSGNILSDASKVILTDVLKVRGVSLEI